MEKWDLNYWTSQFKIKEDVWEKSLFIQQKLGKLDIIMSEIFLNSKMASRIFAFIESKYSSKIEGIYTTLFENVNTGISSKNANLIKPIVDSLFNKEKEKINKIYIDKLEKILNENQNKKKRWNSKFGIYDSKNQKKYEPSLDKKEVEKFMDFFYSKIQNDKNLIDIIISHIIFEKIHPFVDANGRIGRLIFQKQLIKRMHFTKIVPLSWSIYKNNYLYYEAFNVARKDINQAISIFLDIIENFIIVTIDFIEELKLYFEDNKEKVISCSFKIDEIMAKKILFSIQSKKRYFINKYKWNTRTIDKIFDCLIENDLNFNIRKFSREKLYWNIDLETIIDFHFRE